MKKGAKMIEPQGLKRLRRELILMKKSLFNFFFIFQSSSRTLCSKKKITPLESIKRRRKLISYQKTLKHHFYYSFTYKTIK